MDRNRSLSSLVQERIDQGTFSLPVFDRTALTMRQMIDRGEFDPQKVDRLVSSDPTLSTSLLRHANSSFFGGIEKVLTTRDAIVRLGVRQVAELVILSSQREQYRLANPSLKKLSENLWRHAVACGLGSRWLARKIDFGESPSVAFLAGLLHDIGKLVVLRVLDELMSEKSARFQPSVDLVLQLVDGLHCEQGQALMKTWNIPPIYGEIVLHHHDGECPESQPVLGVVRLVDMVCNRLGIGLRPPVDLNPAASPEAQWLRVPEVVVAELEVRIEDAMSLAG